MHWERMIQIEPALLELEKEASSAHRDNVPWFDFLHLIERDLGDLIGFMARKPSLRSTLCVDEVHRHLASVWALGFAVQPATPIGKPVEVASHATC